MNNDIDLLRKLSYQGAKERWGDPLSKEVQERLDYELEVMNRLGVSGYFLIAQDLVTEARRMGAMVGPGKGPAPSSAVAYALGVTSINPIRHRLLFERFLCPDRLALPSICLDFDCLGRRKILRYFEQKYGGENFGYAPFTLTRLKELARQEKCLRFLRETEGVSLDLNALPYDDAATLELFARGDTKGVFQFSSTGIRKWLRMLTPHSFEQLVALYALYSPGAKGQLPHYVARSQGEEPVTYTHPLMAPYLRETRGLLVYQEQIEMLARALADFTRGQAYKLRKAILKRKQSVLEELHPLFMEGCKDKMSYHCAESIWRDWYHVGLFAFCKAHAISYTRIAYQSAYLKAHYPSAFSAAF